MALRPAMDGSDQDPAAAHLGIAPMGPFRLPINFAALAIG
jgi:hypothetical protein